ncbi:MAG: HdeD family acid-resistance protein [Methanotrichaceae archaeon]
MNGNVSRENMIFAPWWAIMIDGIVAIILGVLLVTRPLSTVIALVFLLGWYWLISGILGIVAAFKDEYNRLWKAIFGIIGILAGLAVIFNPILSGILVPTTMIIIVGSMGVVMGAISLFHALKGDLGAAVIGLLSIILGLLLIGSPLIAAAMLTYLFGGLAILGGLTSVFIGYKMR